MDRFRRPLGVLIFSLLTIGASMVVVSIDAANGVSSWSDFLIWTSAILAWAGIFGFFGSIILIAWRLVHRPTRLTKTARETRSVPHMRMPAKS